MQVLCGHSPKSPQASPSELTCTFQWYITAKDPAVLQLDGLGCGLRNSAGKAAGRAGALVHSIESGVPIERVMWNG